MRFRNPKDKPAQITEETYNMCKDLSKVLPDTTMKEIFKNAIWAVYCDTMGKEEYRGSLNELRERWNK